MRHLAQLLGHGARVHVGGVPHSSWWLMLVFGALRVACYPPPPLGGPPDGPYGTRCSSKLDTTLQQMFRRVGTRVGVPKSATYSLDAPFHSDRRSFDDGPWDQRRQRSRPGHQADFEAYDRFGGEPLIADVDHNESPAAAHPDTDYDEDDERMVPGNELGGRIHVAELRVRLPPSGGGGSTSSETPWVRVEKCQFQPANRTLDTRLTFPDLTISGRVQFQPRYAGSGAGADIHRPSAGGGGGCSMILRLRQAGIEFRTIPLVEQRSRTASVRTDSYFADPGFISVFAHGCDAVLAAAATRPNSKRRKYFGGERRRSAPSSSDGDGGEDAFHFDGDILGYASGDRWRGGQPEDRGWPSGGRYQQAGWQNVELGESTDEAYTRELEELFSKGVRGLLTTYMQRALQPAIKETLMESMGYRLSYG